MPNRSEEVQDHLVFSVSGKRGEIPLLLQFTLKGFLDLQPCPATGASAGAHWLFHCPAMPTIHTCGTTFGQSVGEVVYALTERPFALCLGYGAKVPALGKDCLLKLVSRLHRLKNRIGMVVLGLLHSRPSSLVRYGSVSWRVPRVETA